MDGLVVVDKEAGWTSHDVVARCRRLLSERRVGHAGTLDPDATGVLLVGVGRFTRMLRFLSAAEKSYEGEIVLGVATTTLDATGEVVATWDMAAVTLEEVRTAAASLTGAVEQTPPMVSALKVGGRRLHALARAGVEVDRRTRVVRVDRFDVGPAREPGTYRVRVDCSTGTYVRSLAAALGEALGGGAHLRKLRRTRVGSFGLDEAHPVGEVEPAVVLSPVEALRDMAQLEIGPETARRVSNGVPLDTAELGAVGDGPWALVDRTGSLLAVYQRTETGRVVAACVLGPTG